MADERIVTQQELLAALERVDALAECPSCGVNAWKTMGLGGELEPLYLIVKSQMEPGQISDDGAIVAVAGYTVFGLFCSGCGFVRLHDVHTLGLEG